MNFWNKKYRIIILMIFVYAISRLFFALLGVYFNTDPLTKFWQNLDVLMLQQNLLESVYYQHSQPPLFNLFLGIVVKLFPKNYSMVFSLIYHAIGVCCVFFNL